MTRLFSVLVFAGVISLGPPAWSGIDRGPFLQDVKTNRVDIVWEGTDFLAPLLGYGLLSPTEAFVPGICDGVHCYARPEGLAPDTAYTYQLFDGAEPISAPGSMTTAPAIAKPFRFVLYGDNRSDHDSHAMVVQAIVDDVAFIVHSGDLVNNGEFEIQWDIFFAIEAPLLDGLAIYPAIGNHEEHYGKAPIFERLFHTPSETSGSPFYYGFTWSNTRFLIIDGWINIVGWYDCLVMGKVQNRCLNPEQEAWVMAELAAIRDDPAIDHAFVVVHEGPYSSKLGRTGSQAMRSLLHDFAISKVRMILSGHDHYYEHGISGNGLHYMISGGGGAPLYASYPGQGSALWPHEILKTMSVHNYQIIEVSGPDVHVTSHDVDNNILLDDFWLGAPAVCTDPGDCIGEQAGSCTGDWDCIDQQCIWVCNPGPPCATADDCPPSPPGVCPGHWECPFTEQCIWACTPLEECTDDAECAGKAPLTNCAGGHYACELEFAVCEWRCPPPAPPTEPDTTTPDADTPPDAEPDPVGPTDVAPERTPDPPSPDVDPDDDDDAQPTPEPRAEPPTAQTRSSGATTTRDGGGCGGSHRGLPISLWLLALVLLVRRR